MEASESLFCGPGEGQIQAAKTRRWIAEKHFPDFRQATPATWQYLNKNQRIPASGSVG
jgi:hypothetical protein